MMTSKVYRLLMGILCLVLWPGVIAAYGDWRIEQAQKRLKAAGFDPGYIDGVLGVSDEGCTPPLSGWHNGEGRIANFREEVGLPAFLKIRGIEGID